ncbi:peptidoglycan-binding domain-containing protein [Hyphomicrobium sp. LHD-15]|uniref:peptidoglycan-binding domain-containing protein n=1 Tax=Hyphomicrobium sp. LHD-15 TaxID=3072142 RepID=UPI00280D26BA|nr:peptidoglycan-binding domain-containing protein [Hyphomicrobium sp. LHD-15]MDQ8697266.1 peptidoglycan-binding domain-containing protein [Hyphomicrobium sp. LHD-15]
MTPFSVRLTLLTFVLLTGAMAVNIFVFQPPGRQIAALDSARRGPASVGEGWTSQPQQQASIPGPGERSAVVPPLETGAVKPIPETADRSDLTKAIQRELKAKGYEAGAVDGVTGLVTRGAIMAYESDAGLPLTAEPRQALLQHIILGSAQIQPAAEGARTPPGAEAEAVIRAVQRAFRQLGYISTLPDGRLNDATRRAIRKFERDRKLSETGRISGELLAKLATLAGDSLRTSTQ